MSKFYIECRGVGPNEIKSTEEVIADNFDIDNGGVLVFFNEIKSIDGIVRKHKVIAAYSPHHYLVFHEADEE